MSISKIKSKNVELIGNSDLNGFGHGGQVVVQNRRGKYYAYIGHMNDVSTSILDVTDPENPEMLSQIPVAVNAHHHKVRVCGNVMLVNHEQYGSSDQFRPGLRIFDVSDPSNPCFKIR